MGPCKRSNTSSACSSTASRRSIAASSHPSKSTRIFPSSSILLSKKPNAGSRAAINPSYSASIFRIRASPGSTGPSPLGLRRRRRLGDPAALPAALVPATLAPSTVLHSERASSAGPPPVSKAAPSSHPEKPTPNPSSSASSGLPSGTLANCFPPSSPRTGERPTSSPAGAPPPSCPPSKLMFGCRWGDGPGIGAWRSCDTDVKT
mmetsp:Transcript_77515/g.207080  ORF Transcript_77515/g.207080 Transcript_77515/m.207080 type:complete len:205 (-) Transcript_77515:30-644(-)